MTETLQYMIVKKEKMFEIRDYPTHIQAEVTVDESQYRKAVEAAFNILAGFIFGNNISRQKISMTTPVQASRSERIAMTTPVVVSGSSSFSVAFIMPSAYSLETLPQPTDSRILLKMIPARRIAAIRFSGFFREDLIKQSKRHLLDWIQEQGLEKEGDFIIAGYNPPWVPRFLARNEVMVQIRNA